MSICGGISNQDKPADAEIQGLVDKVKSEVTGKMNANFNEFQAVSYRTQVVAGTNYFIKVQCSSSHHVSRFYKLITYFIDSCW